MTAKPDWSLLESVVYADTPDDSDKEYTKLAHLYDETMENLECVGNEYLIEIALKHITNNESTLMLDIAAGTGITAKRYKEVGFKGQIDGIEMNAKMLDIAKSKGLYRKTFCHEVTDTGPLPVENGGYDIVSAVGGFLQNHLPQGCIPYIVQVLKPGGVFVFNSRKTEQNKKYQDIMMGYLNRLVSDKKIELVQEQETLYYKKRCNESGKAMTAFVFLYRKL